MNDPVVVCLLCGDLMDAPTERQIEIFGRPMCCDTEMLTIDRNHLFKLVKGLDSLKARLEKEILRGFNVG